MPGPRNQNIAVLAFPFASHAAPLLSLVQRLSTAAPDARFSFFSTALSNSTIFSGDQERWEAIKSYNVYDGMPEKYVLSGNSLKAVDYFIKATPANFKNAMEAAVKETGKAFSCIITDAFYWYAADLAADFQVPWVAFWTAGPRSVLLHLYTDLIRQKFGSDGTLAGETLDFLPGFSGIQATAVPYEIVTKDFDSPLPTMVYKMASTLPRATALVINSFEEIDTKPVDELRSKHHKLLNIGPLMLTLPDQHISDPHGCLDWLDKQKPNSVAFISFGRVISPPPEELAAIAEALEQSGLPFIWSFRGMIEEQLPAGFLERTKEKGKVVPWAPQLRILRHNSTGAFMTHCGWNSVLESICGGVPMICKPFFADQHLNTKTVENIWGVGVGIEGGNVNKDSITKALEVVFSSEEGKNMRLKIDALKKLAFDAEGSHGSSTADFKTLVEVVTQ